MADGKDSIEKGEYVIGIAIILAALLVSATVWISAGNLEKAMGRRELTGAPGRQEVKRQLARWRKQLAAADPRLETVRARG